MTEYTKAKKPSIRVVEEKWVEEWPTQKGWYWFYGCLCNLDKDEMHLAEVWQLPDGLSYVAGGQFLHKAEGAKGKWQKAKLPVQPK